jgi:excisionase family DNA binding protein
MNFTERRGIIMADKVKPGAIGTVFQRMASKRGMSKEEISRYSNEEKQEMIQKWKSEGYQRKPRKKENVIDIKGSSHEENSLDSDVNSAMPEVNSVTPEVISMIHEENDMVNENNSAMSDINSATSEGNGAICEVIPDITGLPGVSAVEEIRGIIGKLYGVPDIAAALGVSPRTILQYVKTGRLSGMKIGGAWKFSSEDLRRLRERR